MDQRKPRPYLFLGETTSLCEHCLELVPAKILAEGDDVYFQKRCSEHGVQKALVSTDRAYWQRTREWVKPGDVPKRFFGRTEHGCPWDCGICPDHEQHTCLGLVEINEHCNLTCPVCFAGSSPAHAGTRSLAEVERMLDALVEAEGEPDLVQISGGEPTLHPQILEILHAAKRRPIRHVMLNTNGIRIAREPDFVKRLAELKPGFEVYLQFDSLRREALVDIRGADLARIRLQALENLEAAGVSTTLVVVVKKGVNDAELGEIVRFALTYKCVRGVTFQPVQDAGRNEGFDPNRHRVVLSDIRRGLVAQGSGFADTDIVPLPCNPENIAIGYALRSAERLVPLTSLLPREVFVDAAPNAIAFEKYPELKRRVFDALSLSTTGTTTSKILGDLLCCLPSFELPAGLGYDNVFRVVIVQFLDRYNFDLGQVKRSCIHFVTPDGGIIPFDTYNLFYRTRTHRRLRTPAPAAG
ncbi:MAG: radical SAM protein [Alphaproteobacteria bacterium]|nr:radical SAM protein [Alphaproteobacteria bacterium]